MACKQEKKTYRAVLFDMDGTLLDTLSDLTAAINYTMRCYHEPEHTKEAVRDFVGNGVRKLLERAVPNGVSEEELEAQLETYRAYYEAHDREETAPYPGIMELLEELCRRGVKTAVVSNKQHAAVAALTAHYFGPLLPVAVGNGEGRRTKPAPDAPVYAMERLGVAPSETLYVGDSDVDAATAKNAGMDCILVSWGFRPRTLLEEQEALAVIDSPEELLAYFGGFDRAESKT